MLKCMGPSLIRRSFSTPQPQALSIERLDRVSSENSHVKVQGWVQKVQKRGLVNFLHVSDGLSDKIVQIVVPKEVCSSAPVGSGISVSGVWQKSSGSKQSKEILADSCTVLSTDSDPRYSTLTPDQLRKSLHLRARSPSFAALLRLRSRLFHETHNFFLERDFVHVDTPVFTTNDCEGAGEAFTVMSGSDSKAFFGGKEMFLTVSGQLHLEAMTSGISRVYTLNGGFRADKQQSSTHLTEFRMLEAEMAFMQDLDEITCFVQDFLLHVSRKFLSDARFQSDFSALSTFSVKEHLALVKGIADLKEFPVLSYDEAVQLLRQKNHTVSENGLSKKNEAFLVSHCNSPVFVTRFPASQKPFYMKRTADGIRTKSFDLLCPVVGELAGGSVREPSADVVRSQGGSIDWYEECRRRGKPISAGFGLGFERMLQVMLGVKNIKDTTPFPRWFKHCQC